MASKLVQAVAETDRAKPGKAFDRGCESSPMVMPISRLRRTGLFSRFARHANLDSLRNRSLT